MGLYRSEKVKTARHCRESLREIVLGYRSLLEGALREEGVTLPQLRLLRAVEDHGDVSAATIARLCQVTPQTLQGMLARAVREKWIVRGASQRNQRIVTTSLTRKGAGVLARGLAMAERIEIKIWAGVSIADLEETNAILDRGVINLHAELEGQRTPRASS
jgi:DNA-binding MarR family transcriptional regulator